MLLCPYCQGPATPLSMLSSISFIDFFQCEGCAKISERPKGTTGRPLPLLISLCIPPPRVVTN